MKRFGYLLLLSASYAGLLTLVFSSNFSRENTFLQPPSSSGSIAGKTFETPVMNDYLMIAERIHEMDHGSLADLGDRNNPSSSEQSPESANGN